MSQLQLAPVPSEILDEFVGQGPLSHKSSRRRSADSRKPLSSERRFTGFDDKILALYARAA